MNVKKAVKLINKIERSVIWVGWVLPGMAGCSSLRVRDGISISNNFFRESLQDCFPFFFFGKTTRTEITPEHQQLVWKHSSSYIFVRSKRKQRKANILIFWSFKKTPSLTSCQQYKW
jgi:hypothetical protein